MIDLLKQKGHIFGEEELKKISKVVTFNFYFLIKYKRLFNLLIFNFRF